jgi:hypothetical protein
VVKVKLAYLLQVFVCIKDVYLRVGTSSIMSTGLEGLTFAYADPDRDAADYISYFNKVGGETKYCSFDGGCYQR